MTTPLPQTSWRNYWLLLTGVFLLFASLIGIRNYTEYQRIEQTELLHMEAQIRIVETSVGRHFRAISLALERIRDELPAWDIARRGDAEAWNDLTAMNDAMPAVRTLIVLDAVGTVQAINRREILGTSFVQRDYFQAPLNHPDVAMTYITPPFKTVLGVYAMSVSRMIADATGKFNGVVTATLDPEEFDLLLQAVRYTADVNITLLHESGKPFVSVPPLPEATGSSPPGADESRLVVERNLSLPGLITSHSMRARISRDRSDLYAEWRERLADETKVLLLLLVVSIAGLYYYQKRQQKLMALIAEHDAALQASEEKSRLTIEAISVGVMDFDIPAGTIQCDAQWYKMLGFAPDAFTLTLTEWFWHMHPEDAPAVRAAFDNMLTTLESIRVEFRFRDVHDGWRWLSSRGRVVRRDQNKAPLRVIATHLDISERKRAETQLQTSEQRMRTLLGAMQDIVFFIDTAGNFVEYYAPTGQFDVLAKGRTLAGSSYAKDLPPALAQLFENAILGIISGDKPQQFEFSLSADPHGQGTGDSALLRRLHFTLSGVKTPDTRFPIGFLGVVRDVTELREADEKIRLLAFHDPLTHLPNRRLLMDRLMQTLAGCERNQTYAAVIFLDLDRFKALNDTHGHDAGDQLLVEVAQRLQARVRAVDTVARLGGDEFVVMLNVLDASDETAQTQALAIAEDIRSTLHNPYLLNLPENTVVQWECSSSIGVCLFGGEKCSDGMDNAAMAELLLKNADTAMYAAKSAGRNLVRLAS